MSTFQAVVYAIVTGFAEFLPIGSHAHRALIPYLLGWPEASGAFAGALALGALLALLIYFRHDWASIISSFLQVLIFRKKPMTLDERLLFFIALSTVPSAVAWYYFHDAVAPFYENPLWIALGLAVFGLPLLFSDTVSRKNKNMFDWTILDAIAIGVGQIFFFIPGMGRITAGLSAAHLRNYSREAAAKYIYYASIPFLISMTIMGLQGVSLHAAPMPELSWFTFIITVLVTMVTGMLAIGGLLRAANTRSYWGYVIYRFALATAVAVVFWFRNR